ncbi:hypothetical protein PHYC_02444 [Phycisphaerales bacterium]|nr:hypothetical protein PHYC_02444 [Phycisphaerales bacterium]
MDEHPHQVEAFEGAWSSDRTRIVADSMNAPTHSIIGAAMQVHSVLGPGLPERIYEAALMIELAKRGIRARQQVPVEVEYEGKKVGEVRLDVLVEESVILELKAVEKVPDIHLAQLVNHLRAARLALGLVINFNVLRLKDGIYRRLNEAALPRTVT